MPTSAPSASESASSAAAAAGSTEVVLNAMALTKVLPGGRVLFRDVSVAFARGAKIGVLGLNGSGKSSLLRILAGADAEFDGELWRAEGVKVGFLSQEPVLDESRSVHANIMDGLRDRTALLERFDELSQAMAAEGAGPEELAAAMDEQAVVQAEIERRGCWNLAHVVRMAKEALRVPPDDADVRLLSGGERRRVALCRLLLEEPGVLLLDEPTNHLDAASVAWLERFLRDYRGTVLAVTHDRYFLDNVANWILEIDRGAAFPYAGNYSVWLAKKAARLDQEKKADRKRARMMQDELEWIRGGVKAQQAKSKARVARFAALQDAVDDERSKERFLSGAIVIPPGPRLGDQVVELRGVSHSLPDGRALLRDVSLSIPRGAIVGVIGANGAGKTTLLRIISGELAPNGGGEAVLGRTVVPGMVSQSRAELAAGPGGEGVRVLEAVCGGADSVAYGSFDMPARQYLAAFNLVGEMQHKLVRSLSGGERNRVHLARVLKQGANLLLLDEPTNDLDVDTLRSLEEALADFPGVSITVSHDRYFLDRLCTHMIIMHGGGRVQLFEGSNAEWEAWRDAAPRDPAAPPLYGLGGGSGGGGGGEALAPSFRVGGR